MQVDCSESGKAICSKYSVKSYPTLKVFKYGELTSDYKGPKHAGLY
jgi:protein disulfide-isomerase A3